MRQYALQRYFRTAQYVADGFPELYQHWLDAVNKGCTDKFDLKGYYQGENP